MPRFRINLFNDEDVYDEEGTEVPDLAAAKLLAIAGARGLMSEHVRDGKPIDLRHRVEVANDDGKVLAIIPSRELITVRDD